MSDKDTLERAIRYYNGRRYEQALAELNSMQDSVSDNLTLAYYLGLTLTKLGRYEEALIPLEQVVASSTSLLHVYQSRMILAFIYASTRRETLAEYELKQLLGTGMESVQVYGSLGSILFTLGRTDEAIETLSKALELNPGYANALNSLGYIYAEEGRKVDDAVELCRKAVRAQPKNPAYLDSLGWAYFRRGMISDARTTLRRALELSPGNREIASHLKAVIDASKQANTDHNERR
jgi:tetratricopeptide (TPR) repeat protein